jgi:YegS/Rv2252/BmrU family lipid kinase
MRIILNPMSRHGAGARMRATIEREFERRGIAHELVLTEGPGHATRLAYDAAAAGEQTVVAAGGDGTLHEIVNGVMQAPWAGTAVGMIPIGTGNDFVKTVPGTSPADAAFETLAGGETTLVDVGVAEWHGQSEYFINAMGTGIDVEVVRQMRRSRVLPGMMIYVSALLRALMRYRALAVAIDVDGTRLQRRIMNLAVCNGPSIGGSFRICPQARTDDGALDVCLIDEMTLARNARMVPRVIGGTHAGHDGVTMLRGATIHLRLQQDGPLWFQLDGELRSTPDGAAGVHVSVAATKLTVIRSPAHRPVTNG